jgi:hypothetical protein
LVPVVRPQETEESLDEESPDDDGSSAPPQSEFVDDQLAPEPEESAGEDDIDDNVDDNADNAITLRRSRAVEAVSWLHDNLPARPDHVPVDAIEPTYAERRTARSLAIALAAIAIVSMLPIVFTRHLNLLAAPPWALWTLLAAVVQLIFAGWLANAPDWATVRVQMILSAALTTLYAMAMTLVIITPQERSLILGLDDVRRLAPAWCGLMILLLAVATWYCGRTSARWRQQLVDEWFGTY